MSPGDYHLRDRFFSVACVLDLTSAGTDTGMFVRVNDMRNGFYHKMDVKDIDLPTDDVRILFRKYLKLGLSYQVDNTEAG